MDNQQAQQNRAVRGYIIRLLAHSAQNTMICHQISNRLLEDKLTGSPDISKQLEYLHQKGYIQFVGKDTAYTVQANDGPVSLTAAGVDLVEGSITDPGVEL